MKLEKAYAAWLGNDDLRRVFDALEAAGGEVRVAGGAVRNSLMQLAVSDIDLCTTLLPDNTVAALEKGGLKAVLTGYEHGTVTAVTGSSHFEITTLREDVETNGRHAVVRFGTDWKQDAERRDLTINALYCDRNGEIFDPLDGMKDVVSRTVRFIGDAEARIEEDYLRILRFFRFFAQYGSGRPDADGLKACAKHKSALSGVSAERIWQELHKLLAADDPSRALLWMRTTGVLSQVLPESEKWGIDLIPSLMRAEAAHGWKPDPLLRLEAVIRPDGENVVGLARRLKIPNAVQARLADWAMEAPVDARTGKDEFEARLYHGKPQGVADRLKLQIASAFDKQDEQLAKALAKLLKQTEKWQRPVFPVSGKDLIAAGVQPGTELGAKLKALETRWVKSGFTLKRDELLGADKT